LGAALLGAAGRQSFQIRFFFGFETEAEMQNWQKERNYRKYKKSDGSFAYMITVDGIEVEVSAEVYAVYSQADRRERYMRERDAGRLLSLERMDEEFSDSILARVEEWFVTSAEDAMLRKIEAKDLREALNSLALEDRQLIEALVLDGVTEREYAVRISIAQKNVNKKKRRILLKLKKFLSA
jgi:DNA-binding CsgD family transcriptional regulator